MAATKNGNTIHFTAANDAVSTPNLKVYYILFVWNGTSGEITLVDNASSAVKWRELGGPTTGVVVREFRQPILFPTGIKVTNLPTSAEVICVVKEDRP